jgi:hypothetical protein
MMLSSTCLVILSHSLIGKPPIAFKGLIRFSIKNYLKFKGLSENKANQSKMFIEITQTFHKTTPHISRPKRY